MITFYKACDSCCIYEKYLSTLVISYLPLPETYRLHLTHACVINTFDFSAFVANYLFGFTIVTRNF